MDKEIEKKIKEELEGKYTCRKCSEKLKLLILPFLGAMVILREASLKSDVLKYRIQRLTEGFTIKKGMLYGVPIVAFSGYFWWNELK
ncbi:unnamed protein product [Blepharisma stoltei]|uniref:Uncharacterized protein n=1 Tax=Blepharisma stoltei TaxID=1481888 RepID=A0AAU9JIY2_9CILI|nr:unnamed protein product [Blepharisma stoltei]